MSGERSASLDDLSASGIHQALDRVRDSLGRLAQLLDGPVGVITLGDVVGGGAVDQPLGERMVLFPALGR